MIDRIIAGFVTRVLGRNKMVGKVREWLKGKKSYIVLLLGIGSGVAQFYGVQIPDWLWLTLASVLGVTFKAGQNRSESVVKALLEEIKKAKAETDKAKKDDEEAQKV